MVQLFAGVIVTRGENVECLCAVAIPTEGEAPIAGVITCGSFSMEGFATYPLALRAVSTGLEWAPVVRFREVRVHPSPGGPIYNIWFDRVEVGADGIS